MSASTRPDMRLPVGFTCAECFAFRFCKGIGVATETQTTCDWFPVRFSPSIETVRTLKAQVQALEAKS